MNLVPALYDIGDYAVATELARQFAYAAQVRLGNLDNTLATNLQADCYAGVYASSGFSGNRGEDQKLVLSPGDLDEAVIAFLAHQRQQQRGRANEDDVERRHRLPALRRLPVRVPRRHRRLRRHRSRRLASQYVSPAPARRRDSRTTWSAPPRQRHHHDAEHGKLQRAAAVAGVVGRVARVGPRDDVRHGELRQRHAVRRGRPARTPVPASTPGRAPAARSDAASAMAHRAAGHRASAGVAGRDGAAAARVAPSMVRVSSRSQSQRPPSLRSRPSATPGEGPVGEGHDPMPRRRRRGGRPLEEPDGAVEGAGRGAHDRSGDDVAFEQRLIGRGQVPLQRRVGDHGHLRVGVLPVQVHEGLVELAERQRGAAEAGHHAGVDEHERGGGHGWPTLLRRHPWPPPTTTRWRRRPSRRCGHG